MIVSLIQTRQQLAGAYGMQVDELDVLVGMYEIKSASNSLPESDCTQSDTNSEVSKS